ncbi:MAG: hypothetical protein JWM21_2155 [Acidobacteria bacterium]|nr:hypothetical protein [Acidobacteriota bacterium]
MAGWKIHAQDAFAGVFRFDGLMFGVLHKSCSNWPMATKQVRIRDHHATLVLATLAATLHELTYLGAFVTFHPVSKRLRSIKF